MKAKFFNNFHIEGYIYDHDLQLKTSGANSKNPGTEYITGNLNIATDEEHTNVIPVHFTYVTAITKKGGSNSTFELLKNVIAGNAKTLVTSTIEEATKVRIDTSIDLNEFYSDRSGKEELVSVKRNEGGFVHVVDALSADRNSFTCDMLITKAIRKEATEPNEKEKTIIRGAVFGFGNKLLPVDFSVYNKAQMDGLETMNISPENPLFVCVKGNQISETIVKTITQESAWGDPYIKEVTSSHKEYVVNWFDPAMNDKPFGTEETLTSEDVSNMMAARELYLATLKKRNDEYKASRNAPAPTSTVAKPAAGVFNF